MRIFWGFAAIALLVISCLGQNVPDYRNPKLPVPDRVADLLKRMTLEEKVEQLAGGRRRMIAMQDPEAQKIFGKFRDLYPEDSTISVHDAAVLRNEAQKYLVDKTRLGIPAIFQGEALHGYMAYGSTSFPQVLGLASTWDLALVEQVFAAASDEMSST